MNIILSVYSKDAFREYQLPSVNNADYTVTLRSDFFHLKKNRNLYLEPKIPLNYTQVIR